MKSIEVTLILNNKTNTQYHLIKFDDENTISVNFIENGKFIAHHELPENNGLLGALKLKENETIKDKNGNTVKCIERIVEVF